MRFRLNQKLLLLINIIGIALAAGAIVAFLQVDTIVHSTLYNHGLIFNYEWALPYWMFERLAIGLSVSVGGINAFSMTYILLTEKDRKPRSVQVKVKPEDARSSFKSFEKAVSKPVDKEKPSATKEFRRPLTKETLDDGVEITALPMVCNKCGKVFSQPLCMFDFKSGKPRLVNVCPYCNAVLAVSGNSKG